MNILAILVISFAAMVYLLIGVLLLAVGDALSSQSNKPKGFKLFIMWLFWPLAFTGLFDGDSP
jgi:hypothetical protein